MFPMTPEYRDGLNRIFESRGRGSPFSEVPQSLPSDVNVTLSDISTRRYGVVRHKLRNGFNPNVALRASHPVMIVTPLEYAIFCGDWKMFLILILEGGADPDYNAFNGVIASMPSFGVIPFGVVLQYPDLYEPNKGYAGLLNFVRLLASIRPLMVSGVMDPVVEFPRPELVAKMESAIYLAMFVSRRMGREVSTEEMFSDVRRHMSVLCVNSNRTKNIDDTEWNQSMVETAKQTLMHLENKAAAHGMPTQVASTILWEKFWFPNFLVEQVNAFLQEKICATDRRFTGFLSFFFDTDDYFDRVIGGNSSHDSDNAIAVDTGSHDPNAGSDSDEESSRKRRRAKSKGG